MGIDAYDIAKIMRNSGVPPKGLGTIEPLQPKGFTPIPNNAPALINPTKVNVAPVKVPKSNFEFNDFLTQAEKWTSTGLSVAQFFKKPTPDQTAPPPQKDNTMLYVAGGGMALLLIMAMMMGGGNRNRSDRRYGADHRNVDL